MCFAAVPGPKRPQLWPASPPLGRVIASAPIRTPSFRSPPAPRPPGPLRVQQHRYPARAGHPVKHVVGNAALASHRRRNFLQLARGSPAILGVMRARASTAAAAQIPQCAPQSTRRSWSARRSRPYRGATKPLGSQLHQRGPTSSTRSGASTPDHLRSRARRVGQRPQRLKIV